MQENNIVSIDEKTQEKLALFVFWEKNGIVRDYVKFYLEELKKIAKDIVVIVNGILSEKSKCFLKNLGCEIVVRENIGFDFSAWKAGLCYKGWDEVEKYQELILCNCSCYGPLYPLSEVFDVMNLRRCDFWGMTRQESIDEKIIRNDPDSVILEHLQSYFLVFRKNVLKSSKFRNWWDNLVDALTWQKEVAYHEVRFTKYLEDAGFTSSSYIDTNDYYELLPHAHQSYYCSDIQIIKDKLPLVKRKLFIDENHRMQSKRLGGAARTILEYIKKQTKYPEELIWQDLLATRKMSEIKDALHLNYILPSDIEDVVPKCKLALICYVYYPDMVEEMKKYIITLPKWADIYIISSNDKTLKIYKDRLKNTQFKEIFFRKKENRGRDLSAYLISGRDVFFNYELICCIHDKKSKQNDGIVSKDFFSHIMQCTLYSKEYVGNIINLFNKEKFCGMLLPPTVYFGPYTTLGRECGSNEQNMVRLYKKLELNIPFEKNTVAPFGSVFWVRGVAIRRLLEFNWTYDDFPKEPMAPDGTISHAIERIFPLVVQNSGYYVSWCSPADCASLYMNNYAYMLRDYNKVLYEFFAPLPWIKMKDRLYRTLLNLKFNRYKYFKYKLLSKITFGNRKKRYKTKYKLLKFIKNERQ
ncbi:rhamnan synthesis F family protein [uncultured Succinatimonas sp.]|uniref:rhamnan synthesis F family protein n=1 Tax=uncultured Succinatimonas sp. TaxID=1262973 RepID=UPI0025FC27B5|nr:rhamnan synthesis F family protein [uncultured Succinatimonas sp.]